jgi:type IV pilus assembly protein PilB
VGRLLSAYQAAELLGETPGAVVHYAKEGLLNSRALPDGAIRIVESSLEHLRNSRRAVLSRWIDGELDIAGAAGDIPKLALDDPPSLVTSAVVALDNYRVGSPGREAGPSQSESKDGIPADAGRLETKLDDDGIAAAAEEILSGAISRRAHQVFLAAGDKPSVQYRIDGGEIIFDENHSNLPAGDIERMVAHLRMLSGLGEKVSASPQTGRIRHSCDGEDASFRFVAWRQENRSQAELTREVEGIGTSLAQLGAAAEDERRLCDILEQPGGMIIASGPAELRSAAIRAMGERLVRAGREVASIEEGLELSISGAAAMGIDPEAGFTFAATLSAAAGQGIEAVLLADMSEESTVQSALAAAMAGCKVIAAVQDEETMDRVFRSPSRQVLAEVVVGRVRRLCDECKRSVDLAGEEWPDDSSATMAAEAFYDACGCPACADDGYDGVIPLMVANFGVGGANQNGGDGLFTVAMRFARRGLTSLREARAFA